MKILRGEDRSTSNKGLIVVALFALAVAFLGGSSRPDAMQTVALRPIAALFLVPVLYYFRFELFRHIRTPLILLLLLGLWMAIQIIPLPPALWQSLPGTGPVIELSAALGVTDVWRPISFVPFRTLNAFASLLVPLAALLLPIIFGLHRSTILLGVVAVSLLCALLGVFQLAGGAESPLYYYEHSNRGTAIGFLANRNHAAVLLSLALLTIAYLTSNPGQRYFPVWQKICLGGSFFVILTVALISGSRAGLVTGLIALAASFALFFFKDRPFKVPLKGMKLERFGYFKSVPFVAILSTLLIAAAFLAFGRIPALDRMVDSGSWDDLRWSLIPTLLEMMRTYYVFGSGFGSFEEVHHIYEPTALLLPSYVNMAHNDWAQLVIEGGLPALAILGAFLIWAGRSIYVIWTSPAHGKSHAIYWIAIFAIIAFGSFADYPLRAPLFQVMTMWLIAAFCLDVGSVRMKSESCAE